MLDIDPGVLVSRLATGASKVKFGRGVLGTTATVMWCLIGLWLVIVVKLSADLVADAVLVGVGVIVTIAYFAWVAIMRGFARDFPVQAIMSGTELIAHYRDQAQAKGLPELPPGPDAADPEVAILPAPDDADDADDDDG
ncbi:hypothetical protein [Caulobacter sp. SSI4214]|uniref:hypothetical protein n=1 Tax=Caulobacter sp. SSI4214 TaxID=2575739 RepID=UPI00143BBCE5|nr:hypothetical protein [Caulobacter sp. SSI4214]